MKAVTGISRIEQETFFRTSATDGEWDFYSRDPKFKRLLERRGYEVKEDHQGLWSAKIPLRSLSVRSKNQKKRAIGQLNPFKKKQAPDNADESTDGNQIEIPESGTL